MQGVLLEKLILAPLLAFVSLLAAIIAYRLLTGGIHTRGLLLDPRTRRVSPLRVQMLMASIVGATTYAWTIAKATSFDAFPAVDESLLMLAAGSSGLLATGQALGRLRKLFGFSRR